MGEKKCTYLGFIGSDFYGLSGHRSSDIHLKRQPEVSLAGVIALSVVASFL